MYFATLIGCVPSSGRGSAVRAVSAPRDSIRVWDCVLGIADPRFFCVILYCQATLFVCTLCVVALCIARIASRSLAGFQRIRHHSSRVGLGEHTTRGPSLVCAPHSVCLVSAVQSLTQLTARGQPTWRRPAQRLARRATVMRQACSLTRYPLRSPASGSNSARARPTT